MVKRCEIKRSRFLRDMAGALGAMVAGPVLVNCGRPEKESKRQKLGVPLYRNPSQNYDPEKVNEFFQSQEKVIALDEDIARFFNAVYRNQAGMELNPLLTINFTDIPEQDAIGFYYSDIAEIDINNSLSPKQFYIAMSHETGHAKDYEDKTGQIEFISVLHEYLIPILSVIENPKLGYEENPKLGYDGIAYEALFSMGNRINNSYGVGAGIKQEYLKYGQGTAVAMQQFLACDGDFKATHDQLNYTPIEYLMQEAGEILGSYPDNVSNLSFQFLEKIITTQLPKLVKDPENREQALLYNILVDGIETVAQTSFSYFFKPGSFQKYKMEVPKQ